MATSPLVRRPSAEAGDAWANRRVAPMAPTPTAALLTRNERRSVKRRDGSMSFTIFSYRDFGEQRRGARAMLVWRSDSGLLRSDARGRHQIGLEAGQQRGAQSAGADHDVEHGRGRVVGEAEHERGDDQDDRRRDVREAVQDRRQDPNDAG